MRSLHSVGEVLQFGVGIKSLDDFRLVDLMDIRRCYKFVLLTAYTPVLLVFFVTVAIVPEYLSCADCPVFSRAGHRRDGRDGAGNVSPTTSHVGCSQRDQ